MNGKIKIFLVIAVWFVGIACGGGAQTAHQKDRGAALKAAPAKPAQVSRPLKPAAAPAAIDCPPEPGWVVGKAHPRYPSGRFLTGVGISGESAEHARDVALKNLAKNIKVDIDSLSKDFISTEGVYAESAIQTRVDAILEGVERKDGYFDKCRGQYYALVVMDRRLEAEKHRQQLKETENRLKNYMDAARQAEQSGNVVRALHQYLSGYEESLALDPQINVLRVISKSRVAVSPELEGLRAKAFESKIHSLVQNVKFAVAAGDGQKIKSMQIPGQPLAVKVYLANGSQQVPVRGLPLTFKYEQGSGTLQADSETNGSGIARAGVRRIDSYNEDQHAIVARIDTPQIHGELNNELSERFLTPLDAKNARFFYSIEKISGMSTQSSAWQSGLVRLVENLIRNIDPNKTPVVGVIRFTDMRGNQMTAFSKILAEDFKNLLAKSDSLKVREISVDPEEEVNPPKIAKQSHLDMYIDGSFHLQNDGLQIIAKLIHVKTNDYMGTSDTLIEKSALRPEDLAKL
nr:hypothetical protein [Nitrospinaceae bacterium]NIS86789.1 hypothetical protein [Nitrospinaceae bacterium]NIT83623.1 hypothetical protein [Nitrospinaceae bacterium]NIU45826.1 hypothetical protein [Nitrospinaceae bacterium]NIU97982.1 hypothetical protein [Nitrospinaceae bacterium]